MTRSFKLTVAYDGTDYAGWQVQPNQRTIQSELQRAFKRVTQQDVQVVGSGRTDSGVHAIAQVASCQIESWNASATRLAAGLNTFLPESIVVTESIDAPDGFHAIRDSIGKRYRYQIQLGGLRNVFHHRYHWLYKHPVEIESMIQAAKHFVGEKDFASFQAAGGERKSTVRTITHCELIEDESDYQNGFDQSRLDLPGTGKRIAIEIEADGFLYNMVRNIVGTLVEVGRGKRSPDWITDVIEAKNRDVAGPTAPPQGLFLKRVDYNEFDLSGLVE